MNIETLRKLAQNPHYKLTSKQKAELAKYERESLVVFGGINTHDNGIKLHDANHYKPSVMKGKNG